VVISDLTFKNLTSVSAVSFGYLQFIVIEISSYFNKFSNLVLLLPQNLRAGIECHDENTQILVARYIAILNDLQTILSFLFLCALGYASRLRRETLLQRWLVLAVS
jgi:hypothetical protein